MCSSIHGPARLKRGCGGGTEGVKLKDITVENTRKHPQIYESSQGLIGTGCSLQTTAGPWSAAVTAGGAEVKQPQIKGNSFKGRPVGEMQISAANTLGYCPGSQTSSGRRCGCPKCNFWRSS